MVNYKIPNAHVCKSGKCIQTSFAVTKDVILGTPFLLKIQPFSVDTNGVHALTDDKRINFEFIESPRLGRINGINF